MSRVLWTLVCLVLPFFLYWLGGGVFERGPAFATVTGSALVFAAWQWFAPWWFECFSLFKK